MKRISFLVAVAVGLAAVCPAPASADVTGFLGLTTTPSTRPARGFAVGLNLLIVGFEFEYSKTAEDAVKVSPSLTTGMFNGLLMTPTTGAQLYVTMGGGVFRERFGALGETNFGTNFGGGIKIGILGPIRLRLDYRVYNLRGTAQHRTPQRFYAGINIPF
jgi:hypothetical protein